jgi:hypothetical protein
MCFKLYETDNGTHGYLVSHIMPFYKTDSSLIMVHTCADFAYAAFSKLYGYSIRLSPKVYRKDGSEMSSDEISSQFIQKEGIGGHVYVGSQENIDPYLDKLTNFIESIQRYIVQINNIGDKLFAADDDTLEDIRTFVRRSFLAIKDDTYIISNNQKEWILGIVTGHYP